MTRVLLVDDTKTILILEEMMLRGDGFEVTTAANGRLALEAIKAAPPDLVVLDIMMPELNGIETCRAIKSNPATKKIPVLMATTKGEDEMVAQAFAAGCDDYLTKPINKTEIVGKIRGLLAKAAQAEQAAKPAGSGS